MRARLRLVEVVAYLETRGWKRVSGGDDLVRMRRVDVAEDGSHARYTVDLPAESAGDAQLRYYQAIDDAHAVDGVTRGEVVAAYVRGRL